MNEEPSAQNPDQLGAWDRIQLILFYAPISFAVGCFFVAIGFDIWEQGFIEGKKFFFRFSFYRSDEPIAFWAATVFQFLIGAFFFALSGAAVIGAVLGKRRTRKKASESAADQ